MKNWLIKTLGGYTRQEYAAMRGVWDDAVAALSAEDRVTLLGDYSVLNGARIDGALIVAPMSGAYIAGCYSERSYFPVDKAGRVH